MLHSGPSAHCLGGSLCSSNTPIFSPSILPLFFVILPFDAHPFAIFILLFRFDNKAR